MTFKIFLLFNKDDLHVTKNNKKRHQNSTVTLSNECENSYCQKKTVLKLVN